MNKRNIMKKIITVILILSMAFALYSCTGSVPDETTAGQTDETRVLSASEAASQMVSKLSFEGDLELSENPFITLEKYDVDTSGISDIAWYVGSGAAADELAVIKCSDEGTFNSVKEAIEARIDYLRDGYSDYGPAQVPKIDNACVAAYNNSVLVYCICENSSDAESMADEMFG